MMPPDMNAPLDRPATVLRALRVAILAGVALASTSAIAQSTSSSSVAPVNAPIAAPTGISAEVAPRPTPTLAPFTATYEAFLEGKRAGSATLRVVRGDSAGRWRVDLDIRGDRGFVGVLGLNLQQSTVFEAGDDGNGRYRPLSQSTVRKGLFLGKKVVGVYDWAKRSAQWRGDLKAKHRAAIPLQDGDMSGLLMNLAIVRDAQPDRMLQYRFVDGGRARDHVYRVGSVPEPMTAGELSFETLRVARTNGGNDDTLFWVAEGVPTPVRILQREDGEDAIDLRLIQYEGQ
jgi:Protein of unknown function (DUF3108)